MRRRSFLASAALAGLGGCLGVHPPTANGAEGARAESARAESDLVRHGVPATVCEEEIREEFHIRAIAAPAFAADWSGLDVDEKYGRDGDLADDLAVVGLTAGDRARAYPISVLWWHEIVNDAFGDPVLVTYCPICRSGMVARRTVAGEPTRFGVSGLLWQPPGIRVAAAEEREDAFGASVDDPDADVRNGGNLVLYDELTESYWSQLLARGICGEQADEPMSTRSSTVTTWADWRETHPGTDVLLPPPHSDLL